jgi:hypothetical protein
MGPYNLPPRLSEASCLHVLTEELPQLLEDVPLAKRHTMWFVYDGAATHCSRNVKKVPDSHYTDRWIGRNGPVLWPPRSPDLTHAEFYSWGHCYSVFFLKCRTSEPHNKIFLLLSYRYFIYICNYFLPKYTIHH